MFLNKLKKINNNHITSIFKGNFVSKFVLVLGGLLLAKYYGASDYGTFGIYLSITSIISVLLSFAQEHLIILESEEEDLNNNFSSSSLISVGAMFFCFILVFIPFGISKAIIILGILSGYLCVFTNNSKFLLARKQQFKIVSVLTMTDAIVSFLFQVLFVFVKVEHGLIIGSLLGFFTAFIAAIFFSKRHFSFPDFKRYFQTVKKRMDLIKFTYPSTLINAVGNNIMPILISLYFTSSLLGEYTLAVKIISVPLLMISSSIATVYYPKAAQIKNREKDLSGLFKYTKKISLLNFYIILTLYFLINLIGIPVLQLFFNKDWENLGQFIFIMSFGYLSRSLINPISDILIILKKNKIALYFNIYLVLANITAIYIGSEKGITYLVVTFSLLLFIGYGILYLYILSLFKKNESN